MDGLGGSHSVFARRQEAVLKTRPSVIEVFDPIGRLIHAVGLIGFMGALATGPFLEFPALAKSLGLKIMPAPGVHPVFALLAALAWATHMVRVCIHWLGGGTTTGLLFRAGDAVDLGKALLWGVFARKTPPRLGRYSYRERLPYTFFIFALPVLVLSGFSIAHPKSSMGLLGASGLLSAADLHTNTALFLMPLLVWHVYFAHFHPEVLFWNNTWITGKTKFDKIERLRPAWAEEFLSDDEPEESAKSKAPNVEDILAVGNAAAREGRYAKAEVSYLDALAHYPGYSQALFNLGVVRQRAGKIEEAKDAFKQFLDQDPFNPLAVKARESLKELEGSGGGSDG